MKFTSQIIAAGSGSIGGCVFSRNRYGAYVRNRSVPVNPGSTFQNTVRANLASLSQAWVSELTDNERASWDQYASQVPRTDALGNQMFVLGINWFVAVNSLRLLATAARLDSAPIIFTGTSLTPPILVADGAGGTGFEYQFTNTDEWAGEVGGRLYRFTGGPTNATRNFFKGPFRFGGFLNGAVVPPTSPNVVASSPTFYELGQRLWVRFIAQAADGRISAPVIVSDVAA